MSRITMGRRYKRKLKCEYAKCSVTTLGGSGRGAAVQPWVTGQLAASRGAHYA
jgi:hypothetical protein